MERTSRTRAGAIAGLWVGCLWLACAAGAAWGAEEGAAADSAGAGPAGLSYTVEATASFHHVNRPYFGSKDWSPDPNKNSFDWLEGFTRVRGTYTAPQGLWLSVGGVAMGTGGLDYYGTKDVGDGLLDQLAAGVTNLGGSGLSLTVGRQDLQVGDGFLIGDGHRDSRAALWNIPLNFYDGVRVDGQWGQWHVLGFGTRISPTFTEDETYYLQDPEDAYVLNEFTNHFEPDGNQFGGEIGWSGSETRSLALGYFQRLDDGTSDNDAQAVSLRGGWDWGPWSVAGEGVLEFGKVNRIDDLDGSVLHADLRGRAGHLGVTHRWDAKGEPYAGAEYFLFSGDDSDTPEDEAYYPWNYRWTDWSRYYVADLTASTLVFNSDSRILKLECGYSPFETTGLRLLLHRIDFDTASSFGGVLAGDGRGFADEADVVVDQSIGDRWSLWLMGGCAWPRDSGKSLVGGAASGEVFASVTYKFEWPGGGSEE